VHQNLLVALTELLPHSRNLYELRPFSDNRYDRHRTSPTLSRHAQIQVDNPFPKQRIQIGNGW
jgi:hypothetical protein